jgi:tRNA (cytidine/uridine-2'-O-)-methyltransferase
MFNIVLYQPEIPPNTGNIMRLAANTGVTLHLIEPLGFSLDEKSLRRAGLDYRDSSRVMVHRNWDDFMATIKPGRVFAISTKGRQSVFDVSFSSGDAIVFGPETSGLSDAFRHALPATHILRIPMQDNSRSLNLANAVAVVVYEAWRQAGFPGAT